MKLPSLPKLCELVSTVLACSALGAAEAPSPGRPNILLIYADDLGIGDVGAYGATALQTPHMDRLAREGLRFTNGYATSATCTPSRYGMLTGEYPWRRPGTGVLSGDAGLIIAPGRATLPSSLRAAGYRTGVVGKWHLGLGKGAVDWNGDIKPGPLEIGFDYSWLMPATGDRVPCVFVEGHRVAGLDPSDPIEVSYGRPIPGVPTGKTNPDGLRMRPSHGHNQSIVNGVPRIGYMKGGRAALWNDETLADDLAGKAVAFMEKSVEARTPFFLYFAAHDPHVPRIAHPRFAGRTALGPRGDVIVQFDETVGTLMATLERLGVDRDTLVILTSDNGPVLDDGYRDGAVERNGEHRPGGPYRGGKYSLLEAGTRVPLLARWPARIRPGVSDALVSQVDFTASLLALVGERSSRAKDAPDSSDVTAALIDGSPQGRAELVIHDGYGGLALRSGNWKFIPAFSEPRLKRADNPTGQAAANQLYDLASDPGERENLAERFPEVVARLSAKLAELRGR